MANVSDFILERLSEGGIRRIFGYPGDGINGLMGALDQAGDRFDYIRVRHEEMSAFMASAHAKFTGEVGCCLATSGPGALHLLAGLYDAKVDHMPVVAIVGQQALSSRPVVIEFITDPDVPPLPPHVTKDQMQAYLSTLGKGDPDQWGILK